MLPNNSKGKRGEVQGWSQAGLAEKTGVAKSLIEKYERGVHSILPEKLEKLAKELVDHIDDLFPESTGCINSEDEKAFNLVQNLKRIKDLKVRDAVYTLTRCVAEGIQISKVTTEIRPINANSGLKRE
ncbi:MAG: helix-turn-helix domain-containing protein [Rickettsiales bacterium]|jgi:transcriptional regulator with XRE-family HTH domain|nr:helix-turn-helix domain-containing protein [Rickettsiales bacterium]